jgi:outer membrane protein assembly factor BamB
MQVGKTSALLVAALFAHGVPHVGEASTLPTSRLACLNGGWKSYGVFKNQGDCVSYVSTRGRNPPAGGSPPPPPTPNTDAVAIFENAAHSNVYAGSDLAPPFAALWTRSDFDGQVSFPLIAHGLVFVTAGNPATLYALDQSTGTTVWSQQPPNPSTWLDGSATYDNGRVFWVGIGGVMTAYDAATGTQLWSTSLPNPYDLAGQPIASNGVVYAAGGGFVYAVDESSGALLATQNSGWGDASTLALAGEQVFASYSCNEDLAFNATTLAQLWHFSTTCFGGGGSTPAYDNGRIYTRDFVATGNLILDAATGNLLGSYAPAVVNVNVSPVAVANDRLWYVSLPAFSGSPVLNAVDVSNPAAVAPLWTFSGDGWLSAGPVLLNSAQGSFVITGSQLGELYAIDAATGIPAWSTNLGNPIGRTFEFQIAYPIAIGAGDGLLVVPASNTLTAFH